MHQDCSITINTYCFFSLEALKNPKAIDETQPIPPTVKKSEVAEICFSLSSFNSEAIQLLRILEYPCFHG